MKNLPSKMKAEMMRNQNQSFRAAKIQKTTINVDARTVEVAFSSEAPVERSFGNEILLHSRENVILDRLTNGGAVLVDHDARDHVGVIENVSIDADKTGRATLRFGKSKRAQEVFDDVVDGIRTGISVGYEILSAQEDKRAKTPTYLVDKWCPMEISLVSIPADFKGSGVGRANEQKVFIMNEDEIKAKAKREAEQQAKVEADFKENQAEMLNRAKADAGKAEGDRVRSMYATGNKLGKSDLAEKAVQENWTAERFYAEIVNGLEKAGALEKAQSPDLGMDEKEKRQFSFQKLINAMSNPTENRARDAAAFELECSAEFGKKMRKDPRGAWIPSDVIGSGFKRDVLVSGTGSNLVATDLLAASFIDLLVDKTPLLKDGHVSMMSGLVGDIAIPKLTGGSAHYWLAENADATISNVTFGQVTMTPKTIAVLAQLSRKLMIQSTPDAEMIIRMDLAREMGLGIHNALINGTGANNQPTGLLNTSGLGVLSLGANGGVITHTALENLLRDIEVDNAEDGSLIYLTNPKVKAQIRTTLLDAGSGRFLDERMAYPMFITNQVPSNLTKGTEAGTCSPIIFGSFRENLMLGMWSGLDITVDPYTGAASGKTRIVMHQDCDVAVRRIESFQAILDVVTG